jgi:hypothetical protein
MKAIALMTAAMVCALPVSPAAANSVDLSFEQELQVLDRPVSYGLDIVLTEIAPTRIGMETRLDLRDVQSAVTAALQDHLLVDMCNLRAEIDRMDMTAENEVFRIGGSLAAELYRCEREALKAGDKGDLLLSETAALMLRATVEVRDNCVACAWSTWISSWRARSN